MKIAAFIIAVTAAFIAGYLAAGFVNKAGKTAPAGQSVEPEEKRVTSIGGVFFKSENPGQLREWYGRYLGLGIDEYGTNFEWRQSEYPDRKGFTQWSPFSASTEYFSPSTKDFMINYRVTDLERLVATLRNEGVQVLDDIEEFEYGKFVHILDPENNKIELWEPNDEEYEKIVDGVTR